MTKLNNLGLQQWHQFVQTGNASILEKLLAEDCVFYSPVVFSPQKGKSLTTLYLLGAMKVFEGGDFHYVSETVSGNRAVLEFECTVDGIVINGVDMIEFAGNGDIITFKVMVRPLKAIHMLHEKMRQALQIG